MMQDEQQPTSSSPPVTDNLAPADKGSHPATVPYERFAEVNRQFRELKAQMAKPDQAGQAADNPPVTAEDIYKRMVEDPQGYLTELMQTVARQELQLLQDEMALRSAAELARVKFPEFDSFEENIIQEVLGLIKTDPQAAGLSWKDLLNMGLAQLQGKLQTAAQKAAAGNSQASATAAQKAHTEGSATRKPQPLQPTFTRDAIARMSMKDFLANEAAINEALKNNQIH